MIKNSNKIETYIFDNLYTNENKEISDNFKLLVKKLASDFKNPNELLINTWIDNYKAFVSLYNTLDPKIMNEIMKYLIKKYDIKKDFVNVYEEIPKKDIVDEKVITKIKKVFNKSLINLYYKKSIETFLNSRGYYFKNDNVISDHNGIEYTREQIGKENYMAIKVSLLSDKDNMTSFLPNSYKKNRKLSMLLNKKNIINNNKKNEYLDQISLYEQDDTLVRKGLEKC